VAKYSFILSLARFLVDLPVAHAPLVVRSRAKPWEQTGHLPHFCLIFTAPSVRSFCRAMLCIPSCGVSQAGICHFRVLCRNG